MNNLNQDFQSFSGARRRSPAVRESPAPWRWWSQLGQFPLFFGVCPTAFHTRSDETWCAPWRMRKDTEHPLTGTNETTRFSMANSCALHLLMRWFSGKGQKTGLLVHCASVHASSKKKPRHHTREAMDDRLPTAVPVQSSQGRI